MKTTIHLLDGLRRALKRRSARNRVRLPLVRCAHQALLEEEMTPGRVAEVLLEDEARGAAARVD